MIGSFDQCGHNNYKIIVKLCLVLVINSVKKFVKFRRSYFTFLSKRTYQLCLGLGVKPISGPKTSALFKFNPEVGVAHLVRRNKTSSVNKQASVVWDISEKYILRSTSFHTQRNQ